MKKLSILFVLTLLAGSLMAQNAVTEEEMMKEWRHFKHQRDISHQAMNNDIPLGPAGEEGKGAKALPDDAVWYPGEWEEVQAIVVTPYYDYKPDTVLGPGTYTAAPVVSGVALYYKYNTASGRWTSTGIYGPYRSVMDTNSAFGLVFFRLMDGIQRGHAEAWVRVEQADDTAKVLRTLSRHDFRHDSVRFIIGPGNSFWYRDCGPICFYYGDQDSVAMMDFEYYPGRALDDSLPTLIYEQMGIPNYINTIEWEGGNCLVDGAGFLFTSDAVYGNNSDRLGQMTWDGQHTSSIHYTNKAPISQAETRAALQRLIGQRETHVLHAYQYDGGTGHIDLYADMCDENGFVFSVMPDSYRNWTDYGTGIRNIDSLCSYTSIFDRPYYMSSIPFPCKDNGATFNNQTEYNDYYTRTYSNHTFVNDLILQPCFSSVVNGQPSAAWDRSNLEQLSAAYPGYTIYPIDVRDFDGTGGAIHCVTKQIPADNPIRILHKCVSGCATDMRGSDIPVSATITNRSGIAHAECLYRINGGEWITLPLNADGINFSASLPTGSIDERVIDTAFNPRTVIDSTLAGTDTLVSISSVFDHIDSVTLDSVFTLDTVYTYQYNYTYDTSYYIDTVTTLRDTLITFDYYIRATSNNGKTITKPITAHQGGYFTFYYDGSLAALDSSRYDFGTSPLTLENITFAFDGQHTTPDPGHPHDTLGISQAETQQRIGQFYPNPASSRANIALDLADGSGCRVAIIDNLGRTVHTAQLQATGNVVFTIDASKLANGIYTVQFLMNGQTAARRLVVR